MSKCIILVYRSENLQVYTVANKRYTGCLVHQSSTTPPSSLSQSSPLTQGSTSSQPPTNVIVHSKSLSITDRLSRAHTIKLLSLTSYIPCRSRQAGPVSPTCSL